MQGGINYATAKSLDIIPGGGEFNLLEWYNKEDLKNAHDIQHNILAMANEALELLVT